MAGKSRRREISSEGESFVGLRNDVCQVLQILHHYTYGGALFRGHAIVITNGRRNFYKKDSDHCGAVRLEVDSEDWPRWS